MSAIGTIVDIRRYLWVHARPRAAFAPLAAPCAAIGQIAAPPGSI